MAGDSAGGAERSLEQTPTWAVAVVVLIFVIISLLVELIIHSIGHWLQKHHKKALSEALEKLKSELMILGFISLLLTVGQKPISKICVSESVAFSMLPCSRNYDNESESSDGDHETGSRRRLLWETMARRSLAGASTSDDTCEKKNKYPLISQSGLNQLHIFVFVFACLHVIYSVLTLALGRAKMRRWKAWERETQTLEYEFSHDPSRFRLTRDNSFVRRHMLLASRSTTFKWLGCFLRQFYSHSVTRVDYLTLRHGFIWAHFSPNKKFDFHKYIQRSLDRDFKTVVGISPPLLAFIVIYLLLNVEGWHAQVWEAAITVIVIMVVNTKLQVIITDMAIEITESQAVVKGTPIVQPSNKRFWFGRPPFLLFLIHFTMFQNAFQIASFVWTTYQFGLRSCFHDQFSIIIGRLILGVVVQFMCSYVTLPLYALVTQMGSHLKYGLFDEKIVSGLRRWKKRAKKNNKRKREEGSSHTGLGREGILLEEVSSTPIGSTSPIYLLAKDKEDERQSRLLNPQRGSPVAPYPSHKESSEISLIAPYPSHKEPGEISFAQLVSLSDMDKNKGILEDV